MIFTEIFPIFNIKGKEGKQKMRSVKKHMYNGILLILLPALFLFHVQAADAQPTVSVESISTNGAGAGELLEVDIMLKNNPGTVSLTVPVVWDAGVLSLVEVKNTEGVIPSWRGMSDLTGVTGKYYAAWNNDARPSGNITENGVLCTMVFRLNRGMAAGEKTTVRIDREDWLLSIMDFDMRDYSRGEVPGIVFTYTDGTVTSTAAGGGKHTVRGTITSFGSETDDILVRLIRAETSETVQTVTVRGNSAAYCFTDVEPGTYIIRVSKNSHVSREFRILIGN